MCEIYGYTRKEALAGDVGMISSSISPYDQENAEIKVKLAASGKPQVFEWHSKTKKGKLFWTEVSLAKVTINDIDRIIAVVRDITDRKFHEAEIARANRANSESISMAAHQLRTPLGSMRWNTELFLENAKEYNIPAEAIDLIKKNYRSNLEVIDLINDLLSVSRIDKNKIKSRLERFSLVDLVKEIIGMITHEAELKGVGIKFRVNRGHRYFVVMDRTQIKEALSNVIGNAVKYSFKKSNVSISLNRKDKFFEIKTSNLGIGIPINDSEHIFKKFFRAKNAIKSESSGSGLGLFIAKSFIEKVDGSISLSSIEGKRTVFIVRIPISATR